MTNEKWKMNLPHLRAFTGPFVSPGSGLPAPYVDRAGGNDRSTWHTVHLHREEEFLWRKQTHNQTGVHGLSGRERVVATGVNIQASSLSPIRFRLASQQHVAG